MKGINKYNFISAEEIFAEVKEELRSYFATGIIDDLMFPVYCRNAMMKFGNGTRPIRTAILTLKDYSCRLPDDFYMVRILYGCHVGSKEYLSPGAVYSQSPGKSDSCPQPPQQPPEVIKTNTENCTNITLSFLYKPGNHATKDFCEDGCRNLFTQGSHTFNIDGNYLSADSSGGSLYLIYLAQYEQTDCAPMIPDLFEFKQYLASFLKYKCFETIFNNTTDETFRQVEYKLSFYKAIADEQFIIAKTEFMKKTPQEAVAAMKKTMNRFKEYEIT